MLKHLIVKELRNSIVTARFSVGLVLCIVVTLVCVPPGVQHYQTRLTEHRQFLDKRTVSTDAHRPPEVLSFLASGAELRLGTQGKLTDELPYRFVHTAEGPRIYRYLNQHLVALDLATVVRFFFALFAIFISYNAVSAEKEEGTLRLLAVFGVSRAGLLLAKYTSRLLLALIPVILSIFLVLLVVSLSPSVELGTAEWLRIGGFFAESILYLGAIIAICLLASAMSTSSSTALLICILFWLFESLVLPQAVALFVYRPALSIPVPYQSFDGLSESHSQGDITTWRENMGESYLNACAYQARQLVQSRAWIPGMAYQSLAEALARTDITVHHTYILQLRHFYQRIRTEARKQGMTPVAYAVRQAASWQPRLPTLRQQSSFLLVYTMVQVLWLMLPLQTALLVFVRQQI